VIGGYGTAFSIGQAVVSVNPTLAHRLVPYDGRTTAVYAASLTGPEASAAARAQADALASRALRQDPTAVVAASTLGLDAMIEGRKAIARQYFTYAQILSRRDFKTQLWAIENAVGRGDVRGALDQYDIALRTTARGGELFFPILASANATPEVRAGLIHKLVTRPPWGEGFINYLAGSGLDARPAAALFMGLRRAGVVISPVAQADVIEALINGGFTEDAWAYYASLHPGVDRGHSRDPHFAANTDQPTPFDWVAVNTDGISTSIQGGAVDFTVPASVSGAMLRQVQLLPPGAYRLSGHSLGIVQEAEALPYWTLICGSTGRELDRVDVPNSATGSGRFVGGFKVPANCPVQVLTLIARPSEATGGLSGQFDTVELVPAR